MSENYVNPSAILHRSVEFLGDGAEVAGDAVIRHNTTIGARTYIGKAASIGANSVIRDSVIIGPKVTIGANALILDYATICPDKVNSGSSDSRKIGFGASIGRGVVLHNEVELGENAIVPRQETIAHIGSFGDKDRVVTIYGSDYGPRISIGCQIGVTLEAITENIETSKYTSSTSAATYVPYLGIFKQIGDTVQFAYDDNALLVNDLKAIREDYGL